MATTRREQTKTVVTRIVDELYNGKDFSQIDDLYADDVVVHLPLQDYPERGRATVHEFHRALDQAFPDLEMEVVELIAEDDRAVAHTTLQGTHQGEFAGFAASNRSFDGVDDCRVYRIVDGSVAELWILPNTMRVLEELDLVPSGPPPKPLIWLMKLKQLGRRG